MLVELDVFVVLSGRLVDLTRHYALFIEIFPERYLLEHMFLGRILVIYHRCNQGLQSMWADTWGDGLEVVGVVQSEVGGIFRIRQGSSLTRDKLVQQIWFRFEVFCW